MSRSLLGAAFCAVLALGSAPAGTAAVGIFDDNLRGVSVFTEQGSDIRVQGAYRGLDRKRAYFTVIYANKTCDPAQAFPIGPFTTDRRGRGSINQTAPNPKGIDVGSTGSISVRIGDDQSDQDGDGLRGPTDVVAVAGQPAVGLVECHTAPLTN